MKFNKHYIFKKFKIRIFFLILCMTLFVTSSPSFAADNSATIYSGSLKQNITRILANAGWQRVVWDVPYDYNWVGQTTITGNSIQDVMHQLLANYPLQAVFFDENHVVLIRPREV